MKLKASGNYGVTLDFDINPFGGQIELVYAFQNADLNIELSKGAFLPSLNYSISGGTSYFNQMNNLFPGQKNVQERDDQSFDHPVFAGRRPGPDWMDHGGQRSQR